MITEAVAPFHLHRDLEKAKGADADMRRVLLITILESQNLAVIRRIPELAPLSIDEWNMVADWAEQVTRHKPKDDDDVSNRDFAFHLMVACGVPVDRILHILERHNTFSRSALEHIQQVLQGSDVVGRLDSYLREVAEALLKEERVPSRDRGRHMLMTLAKTEDAWLALAERFSTTEISDLRQKVLERFVQECNEEVIALPLFVENVVAMCLERIRKEFDRSDTFGVHLVASHMHWVITCLERTGDQKGLTSAAILFRSKFDKFLPHSVSGRIGKYLPKQQTKPQEPAVSRFDSIEGLVKKGWVIHVDRGKQVVLVKDGKSITKYRS